MRHLSNAGSRAPQTCLQEHSGSVCFLPTPRVPSQWKGLPTAAVIIRLESDNRHTEHPVCQILTKQTGLLASWSRILEVLAAPTANAVLAGWWAA